MYKSIEDFDIDGKKVIIRCDFNVPIKDNIILDDTRIKRSLKTIDYAIKHNAKVILLSHLGKVSCNDDKKKNSLKVVFDYLLKIYLSKITFVSSMEYNIITKNVNSLNDGHIILLENTRFYDLDNSKESNCDLKLAKFWASLGEIFIDDAFGTIHRNHASNYGISKYLPTGIGFVVKEEIKNLNYLQEPEHPFIVIMGGGKISDKIKLIEKLISKVDYLLIGGKMSYTFLKAKNIPIGKNEFEYGSLDYCKGLLAKYGDKIILPIDFICNREYADTKGTTYEVIPDYMLSFDIANNTVLKFCEYLRNAKTVFWNGPLGVYEFENFQNGTKSILEYLTNLHSCKTILGGGDIVACANKFKYIDKVTFASTGGGATLKFLENSNDLLTLNNVEKCSDK